MRPDRMGVGVCLELVDAIADLITRLTGAADTGTLVSLANRVRVTVRHEPAGFALKRGDR